MERGNSGAIARASPLEIGAVLLIRVCRVLPSQTPFVHSVHDSTTASANRMGQPQPHSDRSSNSHTHERITALIKRARFRCTCDRHDHCFLPRLLSLLHQLLRVAPPPLRLTLLSTTMLLCCVERRIACEPAERKDGIAQPMHRTHRIMHQRLQPLRLHRPLQSLRPSLDPPLLPLRTRPRALCPIRTSFQRPRALHRPRLHSVRVLLLQRLHPLRTFPQLSMSVTRCGRSATTWLNATRIGSISSTRCRLASACATSFEVGAPSRALLATSPCELEPSLNSNC